jgi:hypothetical protein
MINSVPPKRRYVRPPIGIRLVASHDDPGDLDTLAVKDFLLHLLYAEGNH